MKRTRNIILWSATILFFAVAAFFMGILHLLAGVAMGAGCLILVILVIVFKPGIQKIERSGVAVESWEIPELFLPEICLKSVNMSRQCKIIITKPEFSIGKSSKADFEIQGSDVRGISRKHITVVYDGRSRRYYVQVHKTKNGTKINGIAVVADSSHPIQKGDTIQLAKLQFKVESAYY